MNAERTIRIALAGCGTVGSGVLEIIINRAAALAERTGLRFEVASSLVSDLRKPRKLPIDGRLITDDPAKLLATDYDMLVEVMGGTGAARKVVLQALNAGKPVVTANKALLALHGAEVFAAARAHGTCVAFEASCAGGLPIVGAVLRGLQANRIDQLIGIFNTTCNFVLSSMLDGGMSFAQAVAEAQRCGYAEADPTLDVSGGDTAHKLTVMASLAFGRNIEYSQVALQGIQRLQVDDLRIAREMGYACRLLGIGRRIPADAGAAHERVYLAVRPTLVPVDHPLASLSGTSSGLWVRGDAVGETFYAGKGAGSLPTASAVVADMIEVATGAALATFSHLRIHNDRTPPAEYLPADDALDPYCVRFGFDPARASALADVDRAWRDVPLARRSTRATADGLSVLAFTAPTTRKDLATVVRTVAGRLSPSAEPIVLPVLEASA